MPFPRIKGLEDVSNKLNAYPAETVFSALLHGFELRPITNDSCAQEAERMIEYLDRAFEKETPPQVEHYKHILFMLIKEYDGIHHIRASKDIPSHEFLKVLLVEDEIPQKSLVPEYFNSESQVSEFLHQKKGRKTLSYKQAVAFGKRFKVDPLNFL